MRNIWGNVRLEDMTRFWIILASDMVELLDLRQRRLGLLERLLCQSQGPEKEGLGC